MIVILHVLCFFFAQNILKIFFITEELFGKEAWKYITYVECSPKGYKSQYATCLSNGIDGYPSWKFGNGKSQGGEMELIDIATTSGFKKKFAFDGSLEEGQVPSLGGGGCK